MSAALGGGESSSPSTTVPVIAGLLAGSGLVIIIALLPAAGASRILTPVMSLVTVSDGNIYQTHDNAYCPQSCDFLLFARVMPSPQIEISDGSEISFRISNSRLDGQQQQPSELHFIVQEVKQDADGSGLSLNETSIQLAKTKSGNYRVENLPAGRYIINVIQDLNGKQNHNYLHSLHRFAVNVPAGNNTLSNYPASDSDGTEMGHSNDSASVIVIPKGSGLLSSPSRNFEPGTIKVVIDTNNTVRWVNQDYDLALIAADNESDPGFYNATKNFVLLGPDKTFEYTFTKTGEFGYHGRPWQRGTIVVVAASATVATSSGAQSSAHYLSYDGMGAVPASHVLHGSYDGIDKDNGIVTVNNQRYYLTTLNETIGEEQRGESIDFHNVTLSFPYGAFLTPGGTIIIPDIKFQDGSEEVYGKTETFAGGGGYMSGIGMSSGPRASKEPVTVFTNHVNPQAALTLYNDSVKLLVSVIG